MGERSDRRAKVLGWSFLLGGTTAFLLGTRIGGGSFAVGWLMGVAWMALAHTAAKEASRG